MGKTDVKASELLQADIIANFCPVYSLGRCFFLQYNSYREIYKAAQNVFVRCGICEFEGSGCRIREGEA